MSIRVSSWDIGMRTLSYCILTSPKIGTDIEEVVIERWDCIDILNDIDLEENEEQINKKRKRTCKNISIPDATKLLIEALSKRPFLLTPKPTIILIETQPGGKFANIRMKALSHVLQAFFCIKLPEVPIEFVSAKVKLLMKPNEPNETSNQGDSNKARKKRYKSNKEFSKNECKNLIQRSHNSEKAVKLYNAYKKQDDLADAFLQGCAIITNAKNKKEKK